MKILVLLKGDERDQNVLKTLSQVSDEKDEVSVLHVVPVNGEVPLKENGQVLDFCTEFDLSSYYQEAQKSKEAISNLVTNKHNASIFSLVGNPIKISLWLIERKSIDLVISGAHLTSPLEEVLVDSFTTQIIQGTSVPYLTVTSTEDHVQFSRITVLSAEELRTNKNLSIISSLNQRKALKVNFVHLSISKPDENWKNEYEQVAKTLNLTNYSIEHIETPSIEEASQALFLKDTTGLLAFSEEHMSGWGAKINVDHRTELVNHFDRSILIF